MYQKSTHCKGMFGLVINGRNFRNYGAQKVAVFARFETGTILKQLCIRKSEIFKYHLE
ncbi:hypothetical protein ABIB50_002783 [Mucilaginibacter sp. UYCu711]